MVEQIEIERDYKGKLSAQTTEEGCKALFTGYCKENSIDPNSRVYTTLGFHTSVKIAAIRDRIIQRGRERFDELLRKSI